MGLGAGACGRLLVAGRTLFLAGRTGDVSGRRLVVADGRLGWKVRLAGGVILRGILLGWGVVLRWIGLLWAKVSWWRKNESLLGQHSLVICWRRHHVLSDKLRTVDLRLALRLGLRMMRLGRSLDERRGAGEGFRGDRRSGLGGDESLGLWNPPVFLLNVDPLDLLGLNMSFIPGAWPVLGIVDGGSHLLLTSHVAVGLLAMVRATVPANFNLASDVDSH